MKTFKKIAALVLLLIGIFSFSKVKNTAPNLNLDKINVIQMLSSQELECRPSSKFMFYVETELVKKHRGSTTINASVYILDRVSGQSNLLANENIQIPTYSDAVLHFDTVTSNCGKIALTNGDKIVGNDTNAPYCFNDLIKYETVYASYMRSTNKLLDLHRIL